MNKIGRFVMVLAFVIAGKNVIAGNDQLKILLGEITLKLSETQKKKW